MSFLIFTSLAAAMEFQSRVDAALGLPRDAEDVGDGDHADAATTLHYADIVKKPHASLYSFPNDATVDALVLSTVGATETDSIADYAPPSTPSGVA